MNGLEYKVLHSAESFGIYGGFGIKILVASTCDPCLESHSIRDAARKAATLVLAEVQAATVGMDRESREAAQKERQELLGLFDSKIFVEPIPNGYCSDWCCRHLPWFIVTTEVGRFKVGWRKRVIYLGWEETIGTKTAVELFPNEDVTKGERMIHAWSYDKAREYIAVIVESAERL